MTKLSLYYFLINYKRLNSFDNIRFFFRNEIISALNALCLEHLAFSSKLVFEFFDNIINLSPDIMTSFLPKLIENIERVEWKRGIGSDFTLR